MSNKYEKECWHCGSKDMEDKGGHVRCHSCGATWNYVPVLGPLTLKGEGWRVSACNDFHTR